MYSARQARCKEEREALIAAGWVPHPRGRPKQWEDTLHAADHVAQAAVRSPPPATDEERVGRARRCQRADKARLKASGWIYSPVFGWARPDDEQCAMLKRYRAAGGAFSHPVAGFFSL